MKLLPFFEVNNKKYEIKSTRYLQAEYDKLTRENKLSEEEQKKSVIASAKIKEFQDVANRFKEIKEDYYNNVTDKEKKEKYLAFKELYEEAVQEYADFEIKNKSINKMSKIALDIFEKIVLLALEEQYSLTSEEAQEVWCSYVEKVGKNTASEWLMGMSECLFGTSEEQDPFLLKMKEKSNQKESMRKGLKNIRK